jgi:hypothetical protein
MSKYHVFIALIASALLAGCAGAPKMHAHNPDQSEAWNLAWPADIKIRDAKVPKSGPIAPERGIAGAATVGTLSYLSPPPGFSSGFGAGLSAIAWLADTERLSERSRIIAWVPKSEASTAEAAADLFYRAFKKSFEEAARQQDFPGSIRITEFYEVDEKYIRRFHAILDGDECSGKPFGRDNLMYCAPGFSMPTGRRNGTGYGVDEGVAPEALGGYPAWRVTGSMPRGVWDRRNGEVVYPPMLPEVEILSILSKKLPEWSYIYVAPLYNAIQNDEGKFVWLGFPAILHQGNPLYFIRPEA